jgi:dynein heavy chain
MIGDVGVFLNTLLTYDKNHIPGRNYFYRKNIEISFLFYLESSLKAVEEYLRDPEFNADAIRRVSFAAAGLCAWAINIVQYYRVYCEVEPKRLAAEEATEQLRQTEEQFNATQNKLAVSRKNFKKKNFFLCRKIFSSDYKQHYKLLKINIKLHKMKKMNVNEQLIKQLIQLI